MAAINVACPIGGDKIAPHFCAIEKVDGNRLMAICGPHGYRALIPGVEAEETTPAFDPINRPQHYADRKFEPIDVITDNGWAEGFCLGNAYKYMARAGKKPGEPYDKDLKKAKWYLDFWVKAVEEKRVDVPSLLKGPPVEETEAPDPNE